MPDADLDLAVEGALFSGFGTAGQRCTSLGTVIVHERVHDEFLSRYANAVETAAIGDPFEDVLYGPMTRPDSTSGSLGGSTGCSRITCSLARAGPGGSRATTREQGSSAIRRRACSCTPRSSTG